MATIQEIRALVVKQEVDDGLWFYPETAPEAYLQQELRKLHDLIKREGVDDSNPADKDG